MRFLEKIWYQPRYRYFAWLLLPLSLVFEKFAFRRKQKLEILAEKASVPVVVIGNLTVGGTGKTPVVIALARFLMQQGIKVGVISRGYKSDATLQKAPVIVTDESTPEQIGDEPFLIYRETLCPLVVHPKRVEALKVLLKHFKVDVVLSDDGLQHYALARDIEIVVLDAKHRLGNGFCLPAGPLREPAARLDSVEFILVNHGTHATVPEAGPRAYNFEIKPEHLVKVDTSHAVMSLSFLQKLQCYAVAGIAQPERFFATLKSLGALIQPEVFPDHHSFRKHDFATLTSLPIIMTQKDAVKCENLNLKNAYALEIAAVLPEAFLRAFWARLGYTESLQFGA
jgi:tetraacyldisaccharide 4'-kinase